MDDKNTPKRIITVYASADEHEVIQRFAALERRSMSRQILEVMVREARKALEAA